MTTVSAQFPQTSSDKIVQPKAPPSEQGRGRARGVVPSSVGSLSEGPSVPARIFTQVQPETDTPNTVVPGKLTFECSDVYVFMDTSRISVDVRIVKCSRVQCSE